MTLAEALSVLALEFDLVDPDDLEIIESTLIRVTNTSYNEGWAAGYAEALDESDDSLREYLDRNEV